MIFFVEILAAPFPLFLPAACMKMLVTVSCFGKESCYERSIFYKVNNNRTMFQLEEEQVVKETRLREASHQFAIPGERVVQKSLARGMADSYETSL